MVKPTTTLVAAHVQKLFDMNVKNPPVIKVARHVKKDNLLPILYDTTTYAMKRSVSLKRRYEQYDYLSFNVPKRYTPIGPPVFKATNPIVG